MVVEPMRNRCTEQYKMFHLRTDIHVHIFPLTGMHRASRTEVYKKIKPTETEKQQEVVC